MRSRRYLTVFLVVLVVVFIIGYFNSGSSFNTGSGNTFTESLVEVSEEPPSPTSPATTIPTATTTPFVCNPNTSFQRVNLNSSGAQTNYDIHSAVAADHGIVSADGRYVVYNSQSPNLAPNILRYAHHHVFLYDRLTCQNTRIDTPYIGDGSTHGNSSYARITPDGRYVVFYSNSPNLIPNDANDLSDTFVYDVQTGVLENITIGLHFDSHNYTPFISPSGRYIGLRGQAAESDVFEYFIYDRQTGVLTDITRTAAGVTIDDTYRTVRFLADERYIVFQAQADGIHPFLYNWQSGQATRLDMTFDGQPIAVTNHFDITPDGRYFAFASHSTQMITSGVMPTDDTLVYVRDLLTGSVSLVSSDSSGTLFNVGGYGSMQISDDGRYVAFVEVDSRTLYIKDMQTGILHQGDARVTMFEEMSSDGMTIILVHSDSSLVPDDINDTNDVFAYQWQLPASSIAIPTATETPTVTVTNTAAAAPSVVVSRTNMTLIEGGVSILYNARLSQAPAPDETITVVPTGYDTAQISVSPEMRLLDASNWNTGRNFTVTAVSDAISEAEAFTIISHTMTSDLPDSSFNGVTSGAINVIVLDNNTAIPTAELTAEETETPTPSSTPTETGTPTETITATVTSAATISTPSPTIEFTATPTLAVIATLTATETATSSPTDTATVTFDPPTLTPTPSAVPQLIVTGASVAVTEGGAGMTYNIRLSQAPAIVELVTITAAFDAAQISVSPSSWVFDDTNWNGDRSITITAIDDAVDEPEQLLILTHSAASNQPGSAFNGISGGNINISVVDND